MKDKFPRISLLQPMADALEKFSEVDSERLPVVDNLATQRLIGSISKTDIMLHIAGKVRSKTTR
jgi:CBS domain-containing protein